MVARRNKLGLLQAEFASRSPTACRLNRARATQILMVLPRPAVGSLLRSVALRYQPRAGARLACRPAATRIADEPGAGPRTAPDGGLSPRSDVGHGRGGLVGCQRAHHRPAFESGGRARRSNSGAHFGAAPERMLSARAVRVCRRGSGRRLATDDPPFVRGVVAEVVPNRRDDKAFRPGHRDVSRRRISAASGTGGGGIDPRRAVRRNVAAVDGSRIGTYRRQIA